VVLGLVSLLALTHCAGGGKGRVAVQGGFYVVGSDIVGPDRKIFRPLGANVGVPGSFDWRGKAEGHSADAQAWGWNTVRLNMTCSNQASYSVRYKDGYAAVLSRIAEVVAEYTAKKIVVIVACHDPYSKIYAGAGKNDVRLAANTSTKDSADVGKTYQQQMDGFWRDMAVRYKSNPYVWFNFWNEPFGNDNADFVSMNTHFYDLVRSVGAENLVVADLMNSGNDAAANGAKHIYDPSMGPALDAGKCNILFSLHAYGWGNDKAGYQRLFDDMRRDKLALVVGEFGYKLNAPVTDASRTAATAMFDLAPEDGVGMLVWHATFGDNFSLKKSGDAFYADGGDGSALSPLGQSMWSLGHATSAPKAFSGQLSDSRCPSAKGS
jgi:mannan endo-1,4-beta-mannosidase